MINKFYPIKEAYHPDFHFTQTTVNLCLILKAYFMPIEDKNIPQQQKGNQLDTQHKATVNSREEAQQLFESTKERLLLVSRWGEIVNGFSSAFQLTDSSGQEVDRPVQPGDLFRISLPAPGPDSGNGNDWVKVEAIQDEKDESADIQIISIRVRPTSDPRNPKPDTAHFYTDEATSTFVVKRKGNTVSAEVHGRNEVPNVHANNLWDNIRHAVVAAGSILGLSNHQWKNLTEGLLKPKKDR